MNNHLAVKFLVQHSGAKPQIGEGRAFSLWDEILAPLRAQRYVKRMRIATRAVTNDERLRAFF